MKIFLIIAIVVWIYILWILKRAKLDFFRFVLGSVGLFILMIVLVQPLLTVPLTKVVAAASGGLGKLTGMYSAYYQYAMLFIANKEGSISLYIDYECSGIIEIMAYVAMLLFYPLYNIFEKIVVSVLGVLWIFAANILRIFSVCTLVYFFGNDVYFIAHTIFGRLIFYGLSIVLYFYVFTRSQIIRQKVGGFSYEDDIEQDF